MRCDKYTYYFIAKCLSARQLFLHCRPRSQLAFVYTYIYICTYIYEAVVSHAIIPVKVKARAIVHPGSSVLPESDSPCFSCTGVIKIYTPRKYGHPRSPYSRDFGDSVVILGTPFVCDWRYGSTLVVATGSVFKTC